MEKEKKKKKTERQHAYLMLSHLPFIISHFYCIPPHNPVTRRGWGCRMLSLMGWGDTILNSALEGSTITQIVVEREIDLH